MFHDAVLDVGFDFVEHFHKREVFPEGEVANVHFVDAQNVEVGEHLHEVIDVSFVALKELVADDFGAHELTHFEGFTGIVQVNFEKGLLFAVVSVEVHFIFELAFVDDGFSSVVGFLVETFDHVEEVHEVEGVVHEVAVLI